MNPGLDAVREALDAAKVERGLVFSHINGGHGIYIRVGGVTYAVHVYEPVVVHNYEKFNAKV